MSPKDKRFVAFFGLCCVICIILIKVVFMRDIGKNTVVENLISENTGLKNVSIFAYRNENSEKVCAFTYETEEGTEDMGLIILENNNRGSYNMGDMVLAEGKTEAYIPLTEVKNVKCAVFAIGKDSAAAEAEVYIKRDDSQKQNILKTNLEAGDVAFIEYGDDGQISGEKIITLYDKEGNIIE